MIVMQSKGNLFHCFFAMSLLVLLSLEMLPTRHLRRLFLCFMGLMHLFQKMTTSTFVEANATFIVVLWLLLWLCHCVGCCCIVVVLVVVVLLLLLCLCHCWFHPVVVAAVLLSMTFWCAVVVIVLCGCHVVVVWLSYEAPMMNDVKIQ